MDMGKQQRNYGIELLRILLMYMVCMLHILGRGGVLKGCEPGSLRYQIFWFMETVSYCAVNGFAMISGYTASNRKPHYNKLVGMWAQAWFYSFGVTLILRLAGVGAPLDAEAWMKQIFPVTNRAFWYVSAYFILMFAMPALNGLIFSLDEKQCPKAFLITLVLFSGTALFNQPFDTNDGYSPIWLMVLYCMGAFAKRGGMFRQKSTPVLLLYLLGSTLLSWGVFVFGEDNLLINYVSPTMVLNGILLVVLFSRIPLKGTIIGKISPLVFGVYLFQMSRLVWINVLKNSAAFIAEERIAAGVGYAIAMALLLFTVGILVEWVRSALEKGLKLGVLYQRVAKAIDRILEKLTVLLR